MVHGPEEGSTFSRSHQEDEDLSPRESASVTPVFKLNASYMPDIVWGFARVSAQEIAHLITEGQYNTERRCDLLKAFFTLERAGIGIQGSLSAAQFEAMLVYSEQDELPIELLLTFMANELGNQISRVNTIIYLLKQSDTPHLASPHFAKLEILLRDMDANLQVLVSQKDRIYASKKVADNEDYQQALYQLNSSDRGLPTLMSAIEELQGLLQSTFNNEAFAQTLPTRLTTITSLYTKFYNPVFDLEQSA